LSFIVPTLSILKIILFSKGYLQEKKSKKVSYRGVFATKITGGPLANIFSINPKNAANTNVIYWAGRLLALWEGGLPYRLEPDSLRTIGAYTLKGVFILTFCYLPPYLLFIAALFGYSF
jgi:carotenoid cleavage dioxygenase-like enzyme